MLTYKDSERFATTAKWEKTGWASKLSALLSERALEVYSRLSEEAAQDYDRVGSLWYHPRRKKQRISRMIQRK